MSYMKPPEPCLWCDRHAHAARKLAEVERLLGIWARGNDLVLGKAAAKVLRQIMEVGA